MATNVVNNAAKAVTGAVNAAVNAVNGAVTGATNAANKAANGAANAASNLFTNVTNQVSNAGKNMNKAMNNVSSVIPFANSPKANNRGNGGNGAAAPPNATRNVMNALPAAANFNVAPNTTSPWAWPLGIFVGLVLVFLLIFSIFNKQIKQGYEYIFNSIRQAMGLPANPAVEASIIPTEGTTQDIVMPPAPPQENAPSVNKEEQILEKLLPLGAEGKEVFNVSQNKFNYYDAEPLCKALGAELASYEQVKSAWERGADWCNYGWVKGQMAVYPTQQETFDKLQSGPVEERMACGTVGVNGGFFDNPELRYGVNCYGKKPSQSAHDEEMLMKQGKVPPTPDMLKVDQKMNEFKRDADGLFVQPFNQQKWSDGLF